MHDQAWSQAAASGALTSGQIALARADGESSTVLLTNASTTSTTITVASPDGTWSQDVTVAATTTAAVDVPAEVGAVTLTGAGSARAAAAAVVTAQVDGPQAGTLIAVVPALADATSLSSRRILLY